MYHAARMSWPSWYATAAHHMQIPNFVLAGPIICIATSAVVHYARQRPDICLSVGGILPASMWHRSERPAPKAQAGYAAEAMFVFVAQLAAMLVFGTLFMYIQVRPLTYPAQMRPYQCCCCT